MDEEGETAHIHQIAALCLEIIIIFFSKRKIYWGVCGEQEILVCRNFKTKYTVKLGWNELGYIVLGYNELGYIVLGYNDPRYNEHQVITNKIKSVGWFQFF